MLKPRNDQSQRIKQSQESYEESDNRRTEEEGEETRRKTATQRLLAASCCSSYRAPAQIHHVDDFFLMYASNWFCFTFISPVFCTVLSTGIHFHFFIFNLSSFLREDAFAVCAFFISFCQAPLRRCGLLVASPGLLFEEAFFMVSGLDSKSAEVEIQLENIVGKSLEQTTQRKSVKRWSA